MKIQYFGNKTFGVSGKTQKVVFEPNEKNTEKVDVVTLSNGEKTDSLVAKKVLCLPGEFEISEILIKGVLTENGKNTIFKVFMEEMSIVHFGSITDIPQPKTLDQLGENIDLAFIHISEKFPAKKTKELIEKIEPRMAILGGDQKNLSEIKSLMNIEVSETNSLEVLKSKLPDENTDIRIIPEN